MTTRKYSSRSQQTTLTASLGAADTTALVVSGSALLGGVSVSAGQTYTVVIDPDTALEEIVDVIAVPATNTLTITRGVETGGTGQAHSAGAVVRHMAIGRDFREANEHIENTTTAHGLTLANVVKTTDTGTVTSTMIANDTIVNADINSAAAIAAAKIAGTAVTQADTGTVTSTMIANGTIVDADINSAAAIAKTKISGTAITAADTGTVTSTMIADGTIVNADINSAAAIDKTKISGTAVTLSDVGTVTGTMIASDTITNADVNSSAQIAYSKLTLTNSIVNADINASAAIDKTKISGTAITAADTGTVTSAMIANGTIVDADINTAAAITATKVAGTAVTQADTGTVTSTMIADGTIVDADINASAAIAWTKIAPSATVSAIELGYVDGVTSPIQTQIDSKLASSVAASTYAPLANPALTGIPTAPTATAGTNTTQVATTAFVGTAVSNLVAAAPAALDTLNELAASLGNDANFATTVTNNLATKLPLAGGTMSGAIAMGSNKITGLGTPTVTGDAATKDYADTKLALSGGTMSGAIAMGTNKITGLGTPTVSTDAATKAYADTMLPLSGGTMTGAIAMGTNKITGLGNPTNAQDAATKYYIDNVILAPSNLTGPITSVGNATSVASQTGTGSTFVMNTSPTLVTPVLGVATATSINGTTIPTSKTLVATDSTQYVVPSQTGNSGKYLTTDGTTSSWGTVNQYTAPTLGSTSIGSGATVSNVNGLTINSTTIPTSKTLVATDSTTYVVPSQTGNSGKYLTTDGTTSSWGTVSSYSAPTIGSTSIPSGSTVTTIAGLTLTAPVINTAINAQAASYTLVLADNGKLVEMNNASANNLTVPLNATVAYPVGATINILQTGAGQTTIVATGGVTINGTPGLKLRAQWSSATLIKRATDTWVLIGDLSA